MATKTKTTHASKNHNHAKKAAARKTEYGFGAPFRTAAFKKHARRCHEKKDGLFCRRFAGHNVRHAFVNAKELRRRLVTFKEKYGWAPA